MCTKRCGSTTRCETDGQQCLYVCYQCLRFLVVITIHLLLRLRQSCRKAALGLFVWLVTCFRVLGNMCFKCLGNGSVKRLVDEHMLQVMPGTGTTI